MNRYKVLIGVFVCATTSSFAFGQDSGPSLGSMYNSVGKQLENGTLKTPYYRQAESMATEQVRRLPDLISIQEVARYDKGKEDSDKKDDPNNCFQPNANNSCLRDNVTIQMTIEKGKETISVKKYDDKISEYKGDLDKEFNTHALKMVGAYLNTPLMPFYRGGTTQDLGTEEIQFQYDKTKKIVAKKLEFDTGKTPAFILDYCTPVRNVPGHGTAWFDPTTGQMVKLHVEGHGKALASGQPSDKCPSPDHYISEDFEYEKTSLGNSDKTLWLPKISIVKVGPSQDEYLLNFTVYTDYKLFGSKSTHVSPDEIPKDSKSATDKPTDPFKK